MLITQISMANEYACKLRNSAMGNFLGKFKESAIDSTIILMGIHEEAKNILDLGDYNEEKRKALLSIISKQSESAPPALQSSEDIPICKAFKAGKALLVNQNEVLQNCI